ncbi:MAG: (4Fe-4S)-binding protein [Actinomycetota bacterium]|nr:(4Fe-4S)-binding protein [Actinomycetota bacterium]MDQ2955618.1 (4Fe-4S)-binding protein [Actinomycetota bacterium]
MTRKTYSGTLIEVSFDGALCQHAAECVRGMPSVFDTSARPWIDPGSVADVAGRDLLIEVIGRCPSGALRYETKEDLDVAATSPERPGRSNGSADVGA